ncbi:MAG: N-acetyltransferase, partial [Pseudomonadota bacterium]
MGEMTVRPERPGDARSIRSVTKAAFSGVPYSDGSEPSIPGALRAAGDLAFSAVAEKARRLIGHVALSPVTIGSTGTGWYGLGPLSVLPDHQRQGTGTALMAAALDWLDRERAAGCVLVGDPGYYGRFGFL